MMLQLLPLLVRAFLAATVPAKPEPEPAGAQAFVDESARCPRAVKHCFGIALHVAQADGVPVQTPAWLKEHVETANRLFAPIDVAFEVAAAELDADAPADIQSRLDRDVLGRDDHTKKVIHVYVVRRLDDVDADGQIRGVHWRDRINTARRWIILSGIGNRYVLAHELGHFFGLPHSRDFESIMNKRPREISLEALEFVPRERERMAKRRDQMLNDGTLEPRKRPSP